MTAIVVIAKEAKPAREPRESSQVWTNVNAVVDPNAASANPMIPNLGTKSAKSAACTTSATP